MFKRMSVLVRRPDHDRRTFSNLWRRHAAPVSQLPRIRGYIQNHIETEFSPASPIKADGFVELLWDQPEDMAIAFASDAARPMVEDEPGFLGHGSGYAISGSAWRFEALASKLVIIVTRDGSVVYNAATNLPGLKACFRDDVSALIAKPGMTPPQNVDTFFHLWFADDPAARDAAIRMTEFSQSTVDFGVYLVRPIRYV
ncbi:EthD family reductase [Brevundimonas sp. SPF441]|uniref:EthD family reductase n=1 Tax=Brevundimonas sp. SPF441 TaxID=2663795 RepID=UPI00129D3AF3|nr:EthD family reductase [Brevundimonas sp. SPF441]MRL70397.1 EthD family reductase [Brevundimonas sp. SPF441]